MLLLNLQTNDLFVGKTYSDTEVITFRKVLKNIKEELAKVLQVFLGSITLE